MDAMTILNRCRNGANDIKRLKEKIDRLYDVLTNDSAPTADPNGGGRGSGDKDKMGRIMAEIDVLQQEKAAREEAWMAEKTAACTIVDMVPDTEGKILYDYYVKRWDTTTIAQKEKYASGYVRKTKRNAEQLLQMLSAERVKDLLPAWYLKEKGGG